MRSKQDAGIGVSLIWGVWHSANRAPSEARRPPERGKSPGRRARPAITLPGARRAASTDRGDAAASRHQVRRQMRRRCRDGSSARRAAPRENHETSPCPPGCCRSIASSRSATSTWIACAVVMLLGAFTQVVAHTGGVWARAGPGGRDHRHPRRAPAPPLDPAQLPGHRAPALPVRVHPPRDAPVLHRGRQRGRAVLAPAALARLPARQGRSRQAPAGHAARTCRPKATSGSTTRCSPRAWRRTTSA